MDPEIADLLKDRFSEVDIDFEQLDTASQILQAMDDDMDYDPGELWTTSDPETVTLPTNAYGLEDSKFEDEDEDNNDDNDDVNDSSNEFITNTESTVCHSFGTDDELKEKITEGQLNRMVDECISEEGSMKTDKAAGVSMFDLVSGIGTITAEKRLEEEAIKLSFDSVDDLESLGNQLLMEHASQITSFETRTPEGTSSGSDEDEPKDDSSKKQPPQSKSDSDIYVPLVDIRPNVSAEYEAKDDMREFTEEDQEQEEESLADYPSDLSHSESEECDESKSGHPSNLIDTVFSDNLTTTKIDDFTSKEDLHDQERLIDYTTLDRTEKYVQDEAISEQKLDLKDEIISEKEDEDMSVKRQDISQRDIQEFPPEESIPEEKTSNKNIEYLNNAMDQADPDSNTNQDKTSIFSAKQTKDANTLIKEMLSSSELFIDEDDLYLHKYDWNLTEEEFNINLENEEDLDLYKESERDWELDKARIDAFYRFFGDQDDTEDQLNRNHKVRFHLDHEPFEYEEDSDSSDETEEEPTEPVSTIKSEYHSESDEPQEKPLCLEKSKTKPKEQQHVTVSLKQSPQRNRCLSVLKSVLALGLVTGIGLVSFWWATEELDWTH